MSKKMMLFIAAYIFAILVFSAHFLIVKKAVYGDGKYYYAYLPSILLEHTFNLKNAFHHVGVSYYLTPKKYPANIYPIGPALSWTIPFLLSHVLLMPFSLADGYNGFYQFTIGIWNISLVFIGLYFLWKMLRTFFSDKISFFTTIVIFFSTNLLFYGAVDVVNSHSTSFFLASLLLYVWLKKESVRQSILLGALIGLLTLVRSQEALFIIFPLSTLLMKREKYIMNFLIICTAAFLTFIPQVIVWHMIWGTWFQNPYLYEAAFYFFSPNILGVLFNSGSGLFLWTPITLLSLIGLYFFTKKHPHSGIPMIVFFLLQLYLLAAWKVWWEGVSYSARMFISSLPIFAIGLGYLCSLQKYRKIVMSLCLFFCVLNPILIILFLLWMK